MTSENEEFLNSFLLLTQVLLKEKTPSFWVPITIGASICRLYEKIIPEMREGKKKKKVPNKFEEVTTHK